MSKKKIAAMAAVLYYLQAKQESVASAKKTEATKSPAGFWSYSGRHTQMLGRCMIQMRQIPSWNK